MICQLYNIEYSKLHYSDFLNVFRILSDSLE